MAKATTTIRQALSYQPAHSSYFAATKDLFNQVAAFYFEVITLHEHVLDLSNKQALTALEKLTHTTKDNPRPVMPLSCAIPADIPAVFRRAAIHAALGSAHAFYTQLEKWRKQKERARARGKKFSAPSKVEQQVASNAETRLCSIDLNMTKHLAVCTILTVEGTVVATRFIEGGKQLHGRRRETVRTQPKQDNAALWAKIRALDEDSAHQVSHRIVEFAQQHQASVLVCEYLGHFKPQKGKYSKRGNEKRSYWLRGKSFKYTKYKAWNEGILTCRVSPRNTSRDCGRCGAPVARYDAGKPAE